MFMSILINSVFFLVFGLLLYFVSIFCNHLILPKLIAVYPHRKIDNMTYALGALVKGSVMLILTIIVHIYFAKILIWYILAFFIIVFGSLGVLPIERNIYGRRLAEDLFIKLSHDTVFVNYKNKYLNVYAEQSAVDKTIFMENNFEQAKRFSPSLLKGEITREEYSYIVNLVEQDLKKQGYKIEFKK